MTAEQPPTQTKWQFALGLVLMLCFSVLLVSVFQDIFNVLSYVFFPALALGSIAAFVHVWRSYSTWEQAMRIKWFRRKSGKYVGASSLAFLAISIITILLPAHGQRIFLSGVFGVVIGYLMGYFVGLAALYPRRNKDVNG
jgi:hypothetical protein